MEQADLLCNSRGKPSRSWSWKKPSSRESVSENSCPLFSRFGKRCIFKGASSLSAWNVLPVQFTTRRVIQYTTKHILIEKVKLKGYSSSLATQTPLTFPEADGQFAPPNRDIYVNITELIDAQLNQRKVNNALSWCQQLWVWFTALMTSWNELLSRVTDSGI